MSKYIKHNKAYTYEKPDNEEILKELGENVRSLRMQLGQTLDAVSERTRIDKATLSRLESGAQNPKFGTVVSVARALGTDPTSLCPSLFSQSNADADWTSLHALYCRLPSQERHEAKNCIRAMLIGFQHQMGLTHENS